MDVTVVAAGDLDALIAATSNASATVTGNLTVSGSAINLATNSGGTTSFGATSLTGGLTTVSVGDITQTGPVTTGAASSITSSTGDITLTNPGNSFFGATSLVATLGDLGFAGSVAGSLTTTSGGATSFGVTTLTGGLTTTSVGDITQTGALITGAASSITSSTGDIVLTNPGNSFFGTTTLAGVDVTVVAAGALNSVIAATGNASVSSTGNLTVSGTAVNLTTTSGGATSFGATTLTGGLTTTSVGDITQTGAIITGAASSITSSTGDIVLTNPGNRFSGATSLTATIGDITFGGTVNGNLSTNAGGATSFAATTVNGNLGVLSGGDITQTGPVIVTGTSSLASTSGNIVLTDPANQFGGLVTATGVDISLSALGNLNVGFTSTGVTTLNNTGDLTVTGTGVNLNVSTLGNAAVGNLTLSGNLNMNVEGSAEIMTGASASVAGLASLISPNSVLQKNGNSLGFAAKGSGSSGLLDFLLNASKFNPAGTSAANNANINSSLSVGGVSPVSTFTPSNLRSVVPNTFIVQPVEAPAPIVDGAPIPVANRYYTASERGTDGPTYRYVYPKVNLGQAYYVGALRGDDAKAAGGETIDNVEVK